jgi:hypothetical protein
MASRSAENGSKAKIFTADPRGFSRAPWELSSEESEEAEDAKGAIQKNLCDLDALCGVIYFLSPSSGLLAK